MELSALIKYWNSDPSACLHSGGSVQAGHCIPLTHFFRGWLLRLTSSYWKYGISRMAETNAFIPQSLTSSAWSEYNFQASISINIIILGNHHQIFTERWVNLAFHWIWSKIKRIMQNKNHEESSQEGMAHELWEPRPSYQPITSICAQIYSSQIPVWIFPCKSQPQSSQSYCFHLWRPYPLTDRGILQTWQTLEKLPLGINKIELHEITRTWPHTLGISKGFVHKEWTFIL